VSLLRAYERVLSVRPLGTGNRAFARSLLVASQQLARAIAEQDPLEEPLRRICSLVARQSPSGARRDATRVVALVDAWLAAHNGATVPVTLRGRLPPLRRTITALTVVFGPGLGLGDEVGFLTFLRRLQAASAPGVAEIFTQYPGTWSHLVPSAREVSYRGDALRLLRGLREATAQRRSNLIVLADYEHSGLRAHLGVLGDADVLEISLGRASAWYTVRDAGTYEQLLTDVPLRNHYWYLHRVAERLLGDNAPPWVPLQHPRARVATEPATILVNALSSKPVLLSPHVWGEILAAAAARMPGTPLRVLLYPGLDPEAARVARDVGGAIAHATRAVDVRLLHDGPSLPPAAMGALLTRAVAAADLCLTLDTFTAHLAPVLGAPTVVLAYAENEVFWVPSPWAFYCRPYERSREAPRLIAAILGGGARLAHADSLDSATHHVLLRPTDRHAVTVLFGALGAVLAEVGHDFPFRAQGVTWVRAWSQLLRLLERTPAGAEHLLPYALRWQQSEFLKATTLGARRVARRSEQ
jgi:hypothetical protein